MDWGVKDWLRAHSAERKSKRSRKGRAAVTVSNTTSLEQLRLLIYEALSVHPKNQTVRRAEGPRGKQAQCWGCHPGG